MHRLCFGFLLGFALFASPAQAQDDLGDALETVGQQYADGYTQPVTDALGANLNAGLFRTAEVGGEGILPVIDIYVGVAGMGALTAGLDDSFRLADDRVQTENDRTLRIEYPNTDLPTAFGENESPGRADIIDQETGMKVDEAPLPSSLIDTPIAPLGVPQVGVGTVLGTDAQLRYLPETNISSYGSVSLFGLSVRHSLSQYIPLSPVNVAVQGTWQSLALSGSEESRNPDEIVDASGWALNAQASKDIPVLPITFYGGVQYEQFGVDVNYTFTTNGENSTIAFDQDAANSVRALAGVSVTLAVIQLNVDYALGSANTVSVGAGLAL
ncbi:MAG: hypothetical protein BRD42_02105 [Bacteroidetes bacterium QS_3_64_15]|nr:MAG: hypothetical protein BRD42_02105 [Bacteroidetes bacterium QS_3_64_15]